MELDGQTRAFLEAGQASGQPPPHELEISEMRRTLKKLLASVDVPCMPIHRREERVIPGPGGTIPVRLYWPRAAAARERLAVLVLYHGGGAVAGDMDTVENMCRYYCTASDLVVVNVEYRLAPEYKFPAGVEDAYAALCWTVDNAAELGVDPKRIAVTGDSAGGNLSAVVCQLAKEREGPLIAFQALVYPCTDFTPEADTHYASRQTYGTGDYIIGMRDIELFRDLYFTQVDDTGDARASPVLTPDLSGLPPALVITAGFDPLCDEGQRYADRLEQAGVPTEHHHFESTIHGFVSFAGVLDVGQEGLDLVADRLRAALAP